MTASEGLCIFEFLISSRCRTITFGMERKAFEIGSLDQESQRAPLCRVPDITNSSKGTVAAAAQRRRAIFELSHREVIRRS